VRQVQHEVERILRALGPEAQRRQRRVLHARQPLGGGVELLEAGLALGRAGGRVDMVDEDGRVVGVISERDLIRAVLPGYVDMLQSVAFLPSLDQLSRRLHEIGPKPVAEFMTEEVVAARPDDNDLHVADLMIRKGLKQIPVLDDQKRLVGVVRRIDLLHRLRR